MKTLVLALLIVLSASTLMSLPAMAAPAEYRAIWADSWHNGFLNSAETTDFINTVADANYNVIIPEIRKAGDAYYDSAYEPWASNITEPDYDALADMITKADAEGIEVWGWLVAYRIWRTNWPSPPPDHIWSLHPDWAMKTSSGGIADGSSYNLDPGVPGVQQYITDVVKDIVSKYDVDGINFDYIRYPGTSWGYNELTKQRFYDEYGYWPPTSSSSGNWGTWCDYRRQQVTDLVKKCYLEAMYIDPTIKMSVDGVGWMAGDPNVDFTSTRAYYDVFQNLEAWMQDHIIDVHVLMNYKREYDAAQQADYRLWSDYLADYKFGRHSVDGNAAYLNSIADSITQMQYGRTAGCDGLCNYSYAVTNKDGQPASNFFDAVLTNMYQTSAPIPATPWKSSTGVIFGQVTDASQPNDPIYQNWIYKATVDISGPVVQSTLTDATGTYGFLDLPAGTYTITCSKAGFPTRTYTGQVLSIGQVLREDFDLGYATASSPVPAGWSLLSLPLVPFNPDPYSVFSGIDIDAKLSRWDKPTQSIVVYDEWMPSGFGDVTVDEGYWLQSASDKTISYQAWAGTAASHTISLPKAGWSIIGCPFLTDRQWADTEVTLGAQTVSLETARNNGWLSSLGYWWDSSTQGLKTLGLPDDWPDSEVVQTWHGYWIQSSVDSLALTLQ